jgi:hypothetical protein
MLDPMRFAFCQQRRASRICLHHHHRYHNSSNNQETRHGHSINLGTCTHFALTLSPPPSVLVVQCILSIIRRTGYHRGLPIRKCRATRYMANLMALISSRSVMQVNHSRVRSCSHLNRNPPCPRVPSQHLHIVTSAAALQFSMSTVRRKMLTCTVWNRTHFHFRHRIRQCTLLRLNTSRCTTNPSTTPRFRTTPMAKVTSTRHLPTSST